MGLPCPSCGRTTQKIIESRSREKGTVFRRRECTCGTRFSTREVIVETTSPRAAGRMNGHSHMEGRA